MKKKSNIKLRKRDLRKIYNNLFVKRAVPLTALILLCAAVLAYGFFAYTRTGTIVPTAELFDGKPTIRFIDVGQGDCTLITYKGDSVLIDAGTRSNGEETADYVKLYAPSVDYFIITHPHEDHMGGAAAILESVDVKNFVILDTAVKEQFYSNAIKAAKQAKTNIIRLSDGEEFDTPADAIHIEILDAFELEYDDYNNASMITKVTVGSTAVLITGDAEREKEAYMLWTEPESLDADILKVGHHGSNTSTTDKFLEAVSPEICVISCGRNNSYGHPSSQVVQRIKDYGARVYRTDRQGTVVLRGEK